MALIDCPGCGNKVSDRAKACPKCGMNLSLKKKQDEQPKQLDQPKVQTEELKKIKEEETDKLIFKEEVKKKET